jgi:hypothetical protein
MHSAQRYRKRAAESKRLAAGTSDRELQERLEAMARGYDAVAESIERLSEEPAALQRRDGFLGTAST